MDLENAVPHFDPLQGNAILRIIEVRGPKQNFVSARGGQTRVSLQEKFRAKYPIPFRIRDFKNGAVGPQTGEIVKLLTDPVISETGPVRQEAFYRLEIASRRVVDGGFDAALEADIAEPDENREGRDQNHTVQRGEARADWEMEAQFKAPTEYPNPRCV
jgi:hypothetical protein